MSNIEVRYKTKYPKIFDCYWGSFQYSNDALTITDEIIENRNKFVEEFDIKRSKSIPIMLDKYLGIYGFYYYQQQGNNSYYDHVETYYTKNKDHIIIISPYFCNKDLTNFFKKRGYIEYNKLYSDGATTFIRVIKYNSLTRKYYVSEKYKDDNNSNPKKSN
jgi:stalled ribosome rescue protein Dom34